MSLRQAGYQSYLAGGAVRDLLMGKVPNDLDLATSATPDQVEALFEKTVMVGRAFGVARVILDGADIEVATFRKDGPYEDGRRPVHVHFCDAKEDAFRRDFTINAMFLDLDTHKVVDYVEGQKDLQRQQLRTVGDPGQRFGEDKLRILRALRFHSQLGFEIQSETRAAMQSLASQLKQVSQERLRDEWQKLLKGPDAQSAITYTHGLGIWSVLFAGWPYLKDQYVQYFPSDFFKEPDQAWSLWFCIHIKEDEKRLSELVRSWKLSTESRDKVLATFRALLKTPSLREGAPVDWALYLGQKHNLFALKVFEKIQGAQLSPSYWETKEKALAYFIEGKLPGALVSGQDLILMGYRPGPEMKVKLDELYRIQLEQGIQDKEELLKQLNG
jgi:tRNA nucleotidyltransferase/poly(A) polymerase